MIKKFKDWLTINGYSEVTISNYIYSIRYFLKYLQDKNISQDVLNEFLVIVKKEHKSPSYFNGYIKSLSKFFTFLKLNLELPRYEKIKDSIPKYLTIKEFEKEIIPMVESLFTNPLKVKAVFYFMYFTGLRISEVSNLKRKDFDLEKKSVKVYQQKTNNEKILFYTSKVKRLLELYFSFEREKTSAFNLSAKGVYGHFKTLKKYFPQKPLHPHIFRHSFANQFIVRGGDISVLKELLGHKSIQSTMRYSKLDNKQLQEKYKEIFE